jgi:hypothetical protein
MGVRFKCGTFFGTSSHQTIRSVRGGGEVAPNPRSNVAEVPRQAERK